MIDNPNYIAIFPDSDDLDGADPDELLENAAYDEAERTGEPFSVILARLEAEGVY